MIRRSLNSEFAHRSDRVVSLSRFVLATGLLASALIDPELASDFHNAVVFILAAYAVAAASYFLIIWNSWWLATRLAVFAHIVDICVFSIMVFLTDGYTSPFFTFFVFLLLAAAIKWGWRATAITAVTVTVLYFTAGIVALATEVGEYDPQRIVTRTTYLMGISLLLIWFGFNQFKSRSIPPGRHELDDAERPSDLPIRNALLFASRRTGGGRALLIWWEEEPWINVAALEDEDFREQRLPPEAFDTSFHPALSGRPFLFDFDKGTFHTLEQNREDRLLSLNSPVDPELVSQMRLSEGLAVPVEAGEIQGWLFVLDVPGLCSDDLWSGRQVGVEISAAIERAVMIKMLEEVATTSTRLSMARDIHDSVVQLLAGVSFRLEAIKTRSGRQEEVSSDLQELQQDLAHEQRELRKVITQLRENKQSFGRANLVAGLHSLTERLSRQWTIRCDLTEPPHPIEVPAPIEHDVHQLVREAVANAVRHGGATQVTIMIELNAGELNLLIADNGAGLSSMAAGDGQKAGPWSLNERARNLGGSLSLSSSKLGCRVTISLPIGARA